MPGSSLRAWLSVVDDEVDRFLATDAAEMAAMPQDPFSSEGLRVAGCALLQAFAVVDDIEADDASRALFDRYTSYLGSCFVAKLGGTWVELSGPASRAGYLGVQLPTSATPLLPHHLVTAAIIRRHSDLWAAVFDYADQDARRGVTRAAPRLDPTPSADLPATRSIAPTIEDLPGSAHDDVRADAPTAPGWALEVDPLREDEALLEAQILDVRIEALTCRVLVLVELRTAMAVAAGNTALLVAHGTVRATWRAAARATSLTAWTILSSTVVEEADLLRLHLSTYPDGRLDVVAAALEFYAFDVPGLPEAPPDYTDVDARRSHPELAQWTSPALRVRSTRRDAGTP